MFGGGAKAKTPDADQPFRATSIRGQLQFWWRATTGASYQDVKELRAKQSEVWGSTDKASSVQVEVALNDATQIKIRSCQNKELGPRGVKYTWVDIFQKNYRKSLPENGPKASYGDPSVPWNLQELAKNLGTVTDNLLVGRPDALQEKLDILIKDLEETRAEVETFALPLAYILDKVKAEYEKLKVCPLESQLQLIKWYSEKGLVHQAIGLASEWLTTILCQLAKVDPQIFKHRESLSRQMNAQGKWRLEDPDQQPDLENLDQPILPDPLPKPLTDCWGNIKEKRNDLMHFGQGKDPLKAETFMNFLKDLPEQLKKIFDSLPKS